MLGHNLLKGVYLANDDIATVQVNELDAVPIAGHILSKLLKALKRKLEVQIWPLVGQILLHAILKVKSYKVWIEYLNLFIITIIIIVDNEHNTILLQPHATR